MNIQNILVFLCCMLDTSQTYVTQGSKLGATSSFKQTSNHPKQSRLTVQTDTSQTDTFSSVPVAAKMPYSLTQLRRSTNAARKQKKFFHSSGSSILGKESRKRRDVFNIRSTNLSGELYETNGNTIDIKCRLTVANCSLDQFRHDVYYSDISFAYLKLVPKKGSGVKIISGNATVSANIWVWTFYGIDGSLEYLSWPTEFGIWSLGFLYERVINKPMKIFLDRVSGNCSNLVVGERDDDKIIAEALKSLTLQMMNLGNREREKYGPSFYCYEKRLFIPNHKLYILCKHMVCPIEALKHVCCSFSYNRETGQRRIICPQKSEFEFDLIWWVVPSLLSVFLFVYSPIPMLYIAHKLAKPSRSTSMVQLDGNRMENVVGQSDESSPLLANLRSADDILLLAGHDHVTLLNSVFSPVSDLWSLCQGKAYSVQWFVVRRCLRLVLPFASLSVIFIQIIIDYYFLYNFVLESTAKGVPLGFRTMLAGYGASKQAFLPVFGGPYVATATYLLVTCLLLLIPESFEHKMESSLDEKSNELESSPLSMNIRTIGMLGSVRLSNRQGYDKIYRLLLAEFYMLLNKRFWHHCITIQKERWYRNAPYLLCLCVLPFYIVMCVLEILIATMLYGFPIVSQGVIMVRSYIAPLSRGRGRGFCSSICYFLFSVILTACVVYSVLMFCTIFLDGTMFVSRIFIFTFAGIIEYPKTAYGYLIFAFTVFYYFYESTNDFSLMYKKLFKETVVAAESVQRANDRDDKKLVHKIDNVKAIRKSLFEFVIEVHRPRRKYVFLALLKLFIVFAILFLFIHLLLTTDSFRELHTIMHVGTALFICALPQIARKVCKKQQDKHKLKKFRDKISETVVVYMEYFNHEGWSSAETNLF